ncbi:MAG TPA: sn-glycerol-3-phosphate ABC transporter ATP-binding protein UgpC [Casimicrobiaceae bacterium]|nr:sn-glycerol-3-phosphate ABC transporter ATP-binding protein UgpC [Casimicrobiaceae bacterium]
MASLRLEHVCKRFADTTVIHDVELEVADGEFVVFVGPSGCGKSTLLRMISGLAPVTEGSIRIDGKRVNDISAADRGLAMVFQSYALYPHMSVRQNLAFGLENLRTPAAAIDARIQAAAKMLRLDALLHRRPTELSGGQRQRVAIGRAIVREPTIFLFDEPLSNLDAELRVAMRAEIMALHQRLGTTMIYVTHDQVEAMTMADRIVVLRSGRVEQVGTPLELYNHPRNRFVAGFIGSPQMNFLPARLVSAQPGTARIAIAGAEDAMSPPLAIDPNAPADAAVVVGIRPEHVTLDRSDPASIEVSVTIERLEQLGAASFLYCRLQSGVPLTVHAAGQVKQRGGETIAVRLPTAAIHLFETSEAARSLTLGDRAPTG